MERLLAYAQIGFSALLLLLFASVLLTLQFNPTDLSEQQLQQLGKLQDQLMILVALVVTYWFQRQRPQTPTDRNGAARERANEPGSDA